MKTRKYFLSPQFLPLHLLSNGTYDVTFNVSCCHGNRPYSYSRYWTGTSLQVRLMRRHFSNILPKGLDSKLVQSNPRTQIWPIFRFISVQKPVKFFFVLQLLLGLGSIMLTSLFSVTGECYRFLHRG